MNDDLLDGLKRIKSFIADELKTRQKSMLPTSDEADKDYVKNAVEALALIKSLISRRSSRQWRG
jgi:hypothetical protein